MGNVNRGYEKEWACSVLLPDPGNQAVQEIILKAVATEQAQRELMRELQDKYNKLLSVGSHVLYGKTELDRQNALCNLTTIIDDYNAKLEGEKA